MKLIEIPKHSIIMTIGPSNCGKSFLCSNVLLPFLKEQGIGHHYLSSDNTRRFLIGEELHKHDKRLLPLSKQAFQLLETQLDALTQYPVNSNVVVVDATFLSRLSRQNIINIARRNGYNMIGLLFDYVDKTDYLKHIDETVDRRTIYTMVKQMKTVVKEIDHGEFDRIYKIDKNDFSDLTFTFSEDMAGLRVEHENICVVGDIHGCYDELITLLSDNKGIKVDGEKMTMEVVPGAVENGNYIHHVLIGDLIDKGPIEGQRKVVEFVYRNMDFFSMVEGNHDRWVYNYLKGRYKRTDETQKLIDSYFDSVKMFEADEELKEKFFKIYERMKTFVYNDKFIATHAPCHNKYLGKSDKVSLKNQNTCRYPKRQDFETDEAYMLARESYFSFLNEESQHNYPIHVFGHVALPMIFQSRNKFGIDTGCYAGNMLGSILIMKDNKKPFIKKYASHQPKKDEELLPLFRVKAHEVDINSLEPTLARRLKWAAKNGVNFVSGTMCPCNKSENTLESLGEGLRYFLNKGVKHLVFQPKHMGSRCNMLLHKNDVSKCKSFSRNAYEIKSDRIFSPTGKTMEMLYAELQTKLANVFTELNAEMLLLDGELLPWNVLGKELIERDFELGYQAASTELEVLTMTGFEHHYKAAEQKFAMDASELKPHERSMKKAFDEFRDNLLGLDDTFDSLVKYKTQLNIFASDAELEFKPFAVLKIVYSDGSEENCVSSGHSNIAMYKLLGNETFLSVDFENRRIARYIDGSEFLISYDEESVALDEISTFYAHVTKTNKMEGIVIKPDTAYVPGVAPFMKCRNTEYLRLVYGPDYDMLQVKYDKLIATKSIKRKLETSIKEYELGRSLLDIPMKDISIDNKEWLGLVVRLFSEQENEKELDPRL